MSGDCVCNPSLRTSLRHNARVSAQLSISKAISSSLACRLVLRKPPIKRENLAAAVLVCSVYTPAITATHVKNLKTAPALSSASVTLKNMISGLSTQLQLRPPDITARARQTMGCNVRVLLRVKARRPVARRTKSAHVSIVSTATLTNRPSFLQMVRLSIAPVPGPTLTPRAKKNVGVKTDLVFLFSLVPDGKRVKNAKDKKAPIKFSSTFNPTHANLRVYILCSAKVGVGKPALSLNAAKSWKQLFVPVYLRPAVYHKIKKLCLCCKTTISASLSTPGGKLSALGTLANKKLRIVYREHPDSTKENPKYIPNFAVSKDEAPCVCDDFYIGLYVPNHAPWLVGQERQVFLLHTVYGYYPQYNPDTSEFKIVTVKNFMYDIHVQYPTEFVRFVLFFGGCNSAYFLVNAECE